MRCLVLGGKGFLGSHLIPALKKKGHKVRSYDIKDGQDILDGKKLEKAIRWSDVVYHLAALVDVEKSHIQERKYMEVNTEGTLHVLTICEYYQKKIIYISTGAIYDWRTSPYALSKNLAEELFKRTGEDKVITPFVVLRLFNVYGRGMNKTTMMYRFQHENPITIYGTGEQTRDFIHINDVINIMVSALSRKWNGFVGDIGTGKQLRVIDIAKKFNKKIIFKKKRQEIYESVADIKTLRKLYKKPFKKLWITQQ